jgi:hypothetical protein
MEIRSHGLGSELSCNTIPVLLEVYKISCAVFHLDSLKSSNEGQPWWYMPAVPATHEVEVGGSGV